MTGVFFFMCVFFPNCTDSEKNGRDLELKSNFNSLKKNNISTISETVGFFS